MWVLGRCVIDDTDAPYSHYGITILSEPNQSNRFAVQIEPYNILTPMTFVQNDFGTGEPVEKILESPSDWIETLFATALYPTKEPSSSNPQSCLFLTSPQEIASKDDGQENGANPSGSANFYPHFTYPLFTETFPPMSLPLMMGQSDVSHDGRHCDMSLNGSDCLPL